MAMQMKKPQEPPPEQEQPISDFGVAVFLVATGRGRLVRIQGPPHRREFVFVGRAQGPGISTEKAFARPGW